MELLPGEKFYGVIAPFANYIEESTWTTIKRWICNPIAEYRWYGVRKQYPSMGKGW